MAKSRIQDRNAGSVIVNDTANWTSDPINKPTVGEWSTKDGFTLGAQRLLDLGPEQMQSDLKASGQFNYIFNAQEQKWFDNLLQVAIPASLVAFYSAAMDTAWPLSISEGQWFYRQGDYSTIDGSSVVIGATRKLPKKPMLLGEDADTLLAPMQTHQFTDYEEFVQVRNVLQSAINRRGLTSIDRTQLYDIANNEFTETKLQNDTAWNWAKRVAQRITINQVPADYPQGAPSNQNDIRGPVAVQKSTMPPANK